MRESMLHHLEARGVPDAAQEAGGRLKVVAQPQVRHGRKDLGPNRGPRWRGPSLTHRPARTTESFYILSC
jgi:hypothetical protein